MCNYIYSVTALTYGVSRGDEDTESLEVVLDSALSHTKMPHVEHVKAAHTDEDDKQSDPVGMFVL